MIIPVTLQPNVLIFKGHTNVHVHQELREMQWFRVVCYLIVVSQTAIVQILCPACNTTALIHALELIAVQIHFVPSSIMQPPVNVNLDTLAMPLDASKSNVFPTMIVQLINSVIKMSTNARVPVIKSIVDMAVV